MMPFPSISTRKSKEDIMKLQLLIPQFNETDEVMRPMLESIST